jgi:hypothetical protein
VLLTFRQSAKSAMIVLKPPHFVESPLELLKAHLHCGQASVGLLQVVESLRCIGRSSCLIEQLTSTFSLDVGDLPSWSSQSLKLRTLVELFRKEVQAVNNLLRCLLAIREALLSFGIPTAVSALNCIRRISQLLGCLAILRRGLLERGEYLLKLSTLSG